MECTSSLPSLQRSISVLQVALLRFPEVEGGVDLVVRTLCDALRPNCRVAVLLPGQWDDGRACRKSDYQGIPVYRMRLRTPWDPRNPLKGIFGWLCEVPWAIMALRKIVCNEDVDIIHLHVAKDFHYLFCILRWLGGPPYIITLHGGDVAGYDKLPLHSRILVRWSLRGSSAITAVSKWLAKAATDYLPEMPLPMAIYNGLDMRRLKCIVKNGDDGGLMPAINGFYFIMVGSFDPYKGHDIAIKAWPNVLEDYPGLKLVLVGKGDLEEKYRKLIQECGCEREILLVGQLTNESVMGLMKGAVGMVFPSRSEGFGLVVLEAGYVKTPVVVARVGPLPEIVRDEIDGLIFEPEDSAGLADAVKRLMADKVLRSRLAESLHVRLLEKFTADRMADEYIEVYKRIVHRKTANS